MDITERIVNHLVMASSLTPDIGLYHGKMGIVIALCRYARFAQKPIYDDFAGELLDGTVRCIYVGTNYDFENGLAGIGWGIEYLLQNHFMEGDSNVVLRNINEHIMKYDVRRMADESVEEGLTGIYYYVQKHLGFPCRDHALSTLDGLFVQELIGRIRNKVVPEDKDLLSSVIGDVPSGPNPLEWDLGLTKGCAGYILKKTLL